LDDVQRHRPDRLAELGYVAFALDYHGAGRVYTEPTEMLDRVATLGADLDRVRALGFAGLEVLSSEPRADTSGLAAVGYCFGGAMVLEMARAGADFKAVVGMHPGLTPSRPEDSRNITGKVLICLGSEDPIVPAEQRMAFEEDMRAAGADWRMHLYGGVGHSFTHPRTLDPGLRLLPGVRYHEGADRQSWRAMLDLFDEVFGGSSR
jgi:dienelactone hydrolase